MAQPSPVEIPAPRRDGTSQFARLLASRIISDSFPDGIGVDERSTRDLLAFVRSYAQHLIYYDADNEPAGNWSGLIGDLTDDQVMAFIDDPAAVSDGGLRRPHVVLLLALFKLLGTARDALNGLVPRHLDYYYRDVLRLAPDPPVPDRVFVLFDLANGAQALQIPAGTRLPAGRDAAKRERYFRTDTDVVVNRAKISRLVTVFTDKLLIGLAEARDPRKGALGTKEERFIAMLQLALGDPLPGEPLPFYAGKAVTYPLLQSFASLVAFAPTTLHLQHYELRELVNRKQTRDNAGADWTRINAILQAAGRDARHDPNFVLNPPNPRDFNANLATALNGAPNLAGLPEITTVDDLYVQRYRKDVQDAITQKLHMSIDSFVTMMDLKRASDADWRVINGLLEHAGQDKRNDRTYMLKVVDPADFAANMKEAIGTIDFTPTGTTSIETYAAAVRSLEAYFFMSAESFGAMMATADQPEANVSEHAWQLVYADLQDALRKKVFAAERDALHKKREAAPDPAAGLRLILADAAGLSASATTSQLLEELKDWVTAADMEVLKGIAVLPKAASADQWAQAYDILERGSRKRTQQPDPLPQRQDWLNLYAYPDALTVHPRPELETRWKTFGAAPLQQSPDLPPPETIGFAIGSPLFALSAGTRQITMTLGFYDDGGGSIVAATEQPFSVEVSTEGGWTPLSADMVEIVGDKTVDYGKLDDIAPIPGNTSLIGVRVRLTLPSTMPAITPLPAEQALANCPWPAVRLSLRQSWNDTLGRFVISYARLRSLRLARIHLRAAVGSYIQPSQNGEALGPLVLENDLGPLDGKRPFEPFGPQPDAGAMLWLGHADLMNKRLRALKLRLDWMGGPPDLTATYAAYPTGQTPFSARLSLVDGPMVAAQGGPNPLFVTDPVKRTQDASKLQTFEIATVSDSLRPYVILSMPASSARDLPHALRLELFPIGFFHRDYAGLAASKAIALAVDTAVFARTGAGTISAANYAVGLPYTPKLKSLTLEFLAGHEVRMEAYQQGASSDMVFHLHPFGIAEASASPDGFPLLPDYGNEGELFIGLDGLRPPETLSLLFQMAEGSANADVDHPQVRWSVLDQDGWLDLSGEAILQDGTRGLINSGIITFALPQVAPDARLPVGPYWLRASVPVGASAVCDTIAIHPQAVLASRELADTPVIDLTPLPAQTIKTLFAPLPAVAAVRQPYPSFGGRPAEDPHSFYASCSERLRHKKRAVTPWDYERLVLRRFPEVYKVKCLPATSNEAATDARDALGLVRLIIIPDIRGKSLFDPFEPKASSALLADIADYLAPLLPGSARLSVENATYVQVRIRVGVRFADLNNPALWKQRLNDDLNRFLSPWAFDEGADIVIGRRIYASSIVNFIDQRPYVDYVAGIKLFSSDDGKTFTLAPPGGPDGDSVGSELPDAVLVAARQHQIDLIADEIYPADQFKGINYMKIELDFIVG